MSTTPEEAPAVPLEEEKKPTCKICCACPDTRKVRDDCVIFKDEEGCADEIEAHKRCLRAEGFKVRRFATRVLPSRACNYRQHLDVLRSFVGVMPCLCAAGCVQYRSVSLPERFSFWRLKAALFNL